MFRGPLARRRHGAAARLVSMLRNHMLRNQLKLALLLLALVISFSLLYAAQQSSLPNPAPATCQPGETVETERQEFLDTCPGHPEGVSCICTRICAETCQPGDQDKGEAEVCGACEFR